MAYDIQGIIMKISLSRFSNTLALAAPAVALLAPTVDAAAYIKFDGVDGESVSKGHEKWIELLSYSWGVSQLGQGGTGAGKVSVKDFTIVKRIDKASPLLFLGTAEGKVVPKVTLSLTRNAGGREVEYYSIILNDVLISGISSAGAATAGADERPMESVSFKVFPKVEIRYTPIDEATGEVSGPAVSSGVIETVPAPVGAAG